MAVKVMPLRVCGDLSPSEDEGNCFTSTYIEALRFAAGISNDTGQVADTSNGPIKVANMSLGGPGYSSVTQAAINDVVSAGLMIVASSGNDGDDNGGGINYPASYDNVISVGSTNASQTRSYFSQYNNRVDIAAPGGDLRVDDNGDGWWLV